MIEVEVEWYCHDCQRPFTAACPTCGFSLIRADDHFLASPERSFDSNDAVQDDIWSRRNAGVRASAKRLARTGRELSYNNCVLTRVLSDVIREGQVVCDVGFAGNPRLNYFAGRKSIRGIGVDLSAENCRVQAAIAARLGNRNVFLQANAIRMPIPARSVDLVIATDLIEHLAPSAKALFLLEIRRVLKADGRVVLKVPYEKDMPPSLNRLLHRLSPQKFWSDRSAAGHFLENAIGPAEMAAWIATCGFKLDREIRMNFLFDKLWDFTLPSAIRWGLSKVRPSRRPVAPATTAAGSSGSGSPAAPDIDPLPSVSRPSRATYRAVSAIRALCLWPDRLAAALGWGNHAILILSPARPQPQ